MNRKYLCVCLPRNLVQKIDENKERLGFVSRADFVKQSIRNELDRSGVK